MEDVIHTFKLRRFLTSPNETYYVSYIQWEDFIVTNPGTESQEDELIEETCIHNYAVTLEVHKYFAIDDHTFQKIFLI